MSTVVRPGKKDMGECSEYYRQVSTYCLLHAESERCTMMVWCELYYQYMVDIQGSLISAATYILHRNIEVGSETGPLSPWNPLTYYPILVNHQKPGSSKFYLQSIVAESLE